MQNMALSYSKEIRELNELGWTVVRPGGLPQTLEKLTSLIRNQLPAGQYELEQLHKQIDFKNINDIRMRIIASMNQDPVKDEILEACWPFLQGLLGPDCLRQKNINLILHCPNDKNSILPMHSDSLTGNSFFEINAWIPLTRTNPQNSMYILPFEAWPSFKQEMENAKSLKDLYQDFKGHFQFIDATPGDIVFFKHFLPHGNDVNTSSETRLSLNTRFKSLFTPEGQKGIYDYYEIFKVSPFCQTALEEMIP